MSVPELTNIRIGDRRQRNDSISFDNRRILNDRRAAYEKKTHDEVLSTLKEKVTSMDINIDNILFLDQHKEKYKLDDTDILLLMKTAYDSASNFAWMDGFLNVEESELLNRISTMVGNYQNNMERSAEAGFLKNKIAAYQHQKQLEEHNSEDILKEQQQFVKTLPKFVPEWARIVNN